MNKSGIVILLLALWLVPGICRGQEGVHVYDERFPFVLITKDTARTAPQLTDEEFYEHSLGGGDI